MATSFQPRDSSLQRITVAVDFGTTYSGAAWHWTGSPDVTEVVEEWPDNGKDLVGFTEEKVPTKIAYGNSAQPQAWGVIGTGSQCYYSEFKLSLGRSDHLRQSRLAAAFPDPLGLPLGLQFNATKLTVDYLRLLKDHVLALIAKKISYFTLENTPIEWTLTIPAIWTDSQKESTRFAADKAGFAGQVTLVTEPEAAMIHAISTMKDNEISIGNTFVLCDCGGGTVDLITYVVDRLAPLQMREVVEGDGARCGGVYVDRAFTRYLEEKFSDCEGWCSKTLTTALHKFEKTTKRKFSNDDEFVLLKLAGVHDNKHKGIKKEKVQVPAADIRAVFEPVIKVVKTLVQNQIVLAKTKQHKVSAILLVGGFGQSPYLKQVIEQTVDASVRVWQIKDGRTAIVKGALQKALNDSNPANASLQMTSRVARKYYGVSMGIPFDDAKHPDDKRYFVEVEKRSYIQLAHWFIKKGAPISQKKPEKFNYYEKWPVTQPAPTFQVYILAWDGPTPDQPNPPPYDEDHLRLARLQVDLSKIPTAKLRCGECPVLRERCFECEIEIRVVYESAGLEYSLCHKGVCYGRVEAKYH